MPLIQNPRFKRSLWKQWISSLARRVSL